MNANELIEYYQGELKDLKKVKKTYIEGRSDTVRSIDNLDEYIDMTKSTVRELSRTRIRETTTEPPTREDGDKNGYVLAYDPDLKLWVAPIWSWVKDSAYQLWTCMPQLPEVTP